ncbi:MAG: DUF3347 domain-containing protein [Bacteroidetes bacterium]|nr:DUF3347 domain-containing protein [Bacteroidota bacterium]MBS1540912.1 DUF3347 domain-containing protein [Bacteroidota bacterium]
MSLVFVGCAAYAQHDHAGHSANKNTQNGITFKDKKLGTAYEHYLHLKNALVASDPMEARAGANKLKDALADAKAPASVVELASKIAGVSGVEDQRKVFSTLTGEMKTLVSGGKLSAGSIYWEYCPMAFNNTGAYWLSSEREIKNPYFGSRMMKCGSVKETIQ